MYLQIAKCNEITEGNVYSKMGIVEGLTESGTTQYCVRKALIETEFVALE